MGGKWCTHQFTDDFLREIKNHFGKITREISAATDGHTNLGCIYVSMISTSRFYRYVG